MNAKLTTGVCVLLVDRHCRGAVSVEHMRITTCQRVGQSVISPGGKQYVQHTDVDVHCGCISRYFTMGVLLSTTSLCRELLLILPGSVALEAALQWLWYPVTAISLWKTAMGRGGQDRGFVDGKIGDVPLDQDGRPHEE